MAYIVSCIPVEETTVGNILFNYILYCSDIDDRIKGHTLFARFNSGEEPEQLTKRVFGNIMSEPHAYIEDIDYDISRRGYFGKIKIIDGVNDRCIETYEHMASLGKLMLVPVIINVLDDTPRIAWFELMHIDEEVREKWRELSDVYYELSTFSNEYY